jgi:cytochrome c oxidase subunit 2
MAAAALLPHAVSADSPYTHITPRTPDARDIQGIYKLIFWMALVVFVGVQAGIAYTALRYRRRREDDERPEQVHGNKTLEIAWTILPAIVLLVIFIPTVRTMYAEADATKIEPDDVVIEVYGKQWWWEVHYKQPTDTDGVITANEIHVPQGKKVVVELYTDNVIHSFWVAQLIGKTDLIPGHVNKLAFTAEQNGFYWGQCAEFCGDSHTNMKFKVIIQPQSDFDAWIAAWKAGPTQRSAEVAGTGDVTKAPAAMGACIACHRINGVANMNVGPIGLDETQPKGDQLGTSQTAGPNLTLFGCRTTIAGGIMENTPENLAKWLRDPASIKPGNYMASVIKKSTLSESQITEIVGYLQSLTPDGGCPPITGEVLPANVASPAANETAVASAIAAAGTAQAADAAGTAQASATAAAASATAAAQAAAQPTPPPAQGAQPPAQQTTFEIDLEDIKFSPNELTIPADTDVTITLKNTGASMHNFSVTDHNNPNVKNLGISVDVNPGETKTVTVNAPAGDYYYFCGVPGHEAAGMHGTMHVVAGGGGAPSGQAQNPPPASGGQAPAPTVNLEDIKFDPPSLTIPANTPVTVTLVNKGASVHTFDIDALKVNSGDVQPGATTTVTINAPAGTYQYYCAIPGHKEAGMVGTLTVQ